MHDPSVLQAEAAVHAARRLVSNLPAGHVVVKLDFSNAFNCVRRDLILDSIATYQRSIDLSTLHSHVSQS